MKVIYPGHVYKLQNFKHDSSQMLAFILKEPNPENPTELLTVSEGTTNEEVIRVLIDRITYLNQKVPCRENFRAIISLQDALDNLESRTKDREKRNVEGKQIK